MKTSNWPVVATTLVLLLTACDRNRDAPSGTTSSHTGSPGATVCANQTPTRRALFGDLHVHTTYSFDAFAYGIQTTPADAYRYARGEAINYLPLDENGNMTGTIKIDRPLDFLAVTDHAEFLGEWQLCTDATSDTFNTDFCTGYRGGGYQAIYMTAVRLAAEQPTASFSPLCPAGDDACNKAGAVPWARIVEAAEHNNDTTDACTFTAFVGYEHSGSPAASNYHRNVIFRNGTVPSRPVDYFEAPRDYQLWAALDKVCHDDCDYLTIPHNSNLSNGRLLTPYIGLPDTDEARKNYTQTRLAREPLMEVFQHKGNSECANGFPNILGEPDELCEMEQVRRIGKPGKILRRSDTGELFEVDNPTRFCKLDELGAGGLQGGGCMSPADFYRTGLLLGLSEWQSTGLNAVKLGAVASTDTHMSTGGAVREDQWRGHINGEWSKEGRLSKPVLLTSNRDGNPGGLAGVWATENSRDAIFDAMKRRETFGTSGPRIQPRLFASWSYPEALCSQANMLETAYAQGVPIGADLPPGEQHQTPKFLALARADPADFAVPLQKLQIIKGWIDAEGRQHHQVFHVAGDEQSDADVDMLTGARRGSGHQSLCAVFEDPSFDPAQPSYYYLRVVENPSPRWSLVDCLTDEPDARPEICKDESIATTIQEQAWTSPIWYTPK